MRLEIGDVGRAGRHGANASARQRNLARRAEFHVAIGVASLAARSADVEQLVLLGCIVEQVMHRVGVVPHDAEVVSRALHAGEAPHDFVGIRDAAGVRVFRHAPDTLHTLVGSGDALDFIHVGAVDAKRDRNHLEPEMLGDREMAVVAGHKADPFHGIVLAPRFRAQRTEGPEPRHRVEHHGQRRVAADNDVFRLVVEQIGHQAPCLGQPFKHAVVAAIGAVFGDAIGRRCQKRQHGHRQIELVGAGLSARHVQAEVAGFRLGVALAYAFFQALKLGFAQICVGHAGLRSSPYSSSS